jgi:hypothetical protein
MEKLDSLWSWQTILHITFLDFQYIWVGLFNLVFNLSSQIGNFYLSFFINKVQQYGSQLDCIWLNISFEQWTNEAFWTNHKLIHYALKLPNHNEYIWLGYT